MERRSVEAIVRALNEGAVRYLIAGGLAVVAHGYVRFTADVDLILDIEPGKVRRALAALSGLRYRPRAPVALEDFAAPDARASWVREKGMTVFSLSSDDHPATEVDIFAESPVDFPRAYDAALRLEVAPGLPAPFVSRDDLLRLKTLANRPQDREDVRRLGELPGAGPEARRP